MMRFPNPEENLLLRMMSRLGLECKPDDKTLLFDRGKNLNIFLKTYKILVFAPQSMFTHPDTSSGFSHL